MFRVIQIHGLLLVGWLVFFNITFKCSLNSCVSSSLDISCPGSLVLSLVLSLIDDIHFKMPDFIKKSSIYENLLAPFVNIFL